MPKSYVSGKTAFVDKSADQPAGGPAAVSGEGMTPFQAHLAAPLPIPTSDDVEARALAAEQRHALKRLGQAGTPVVGGSGGHRLYAPPAPAAARPRHLLPGEVVPDRTLGDPTRAHTWRGRIPGDPVAPWLQWHSDSSHAADAAAEYLSLAFIFSTTGSIEVEKVDRPAAAEPALAGTAAD